MVTLLRLCFNVFYPFGQGLAGQRIFPQGAVQDAPCILQQFADHGGDHAFFFFHQRANLGVLAQQLLVNPFQLFAGLGRWRSVSFPGAIAGIFDRFAGFIANLANFYETGVAFGNHPLLHLEDAIVIAFPLQAFSGFVAFVRARGRMPLRLGHFLNVDEGRLVVDARVFYNLLVQSHQFWIAPGFFGIDAYTRAIFIGFKT